MHKEAAERRAFLPSFIEFVARVGADEIVVEEGYGAGMEIAAAEYTRVPRVRVGSFEECFAQDVVVVLRCP
ncbi:MAG: alanine dehydrogenase, partial [Byssovorax sp.]